MNRNHITWPSTSSTDVGSLKRIDPVCLIETATLLFYCLLRWSTYIIVSLWIRNTCHPTTSNYLFHHHFSQFNIQPESISEAISRWSKFAHQTALKKKNKKKTQKTRDELFICLPLLKYQLTKQSIEYHLNQPRANWSQPGNLTLRLFKMWQPSSSHQQSKSNVQNWLVFFGGTLWNQLN